MQRIILFLAASALIIATPALAEVSQPVEVRHDDLDLTSQQDIARLKARLASAVRRACATGAPLADLRAKETERRCQMESWAHVTPQMELALAKAGRSRALAARGETIGVTGNVVD